MSRAEDIFQKLVYFGEEALDDFIINMQTEELFLDFKQVTQAGKNLRSLHTNDRKNLAKAISGFGNSEGGVLVWGVECYRDIEIGDVAKAKVKIENVHRYMSWIENAISGCTIPNHNKIRNHIISADKDGNGFIATYIPKSDVAPLMSVFGGSFYIRSGSNNVPAPYSVLAGMFGRRPQANIEFLLSDKSIEVVDSSQLLNNGSDSPKKYANINFTIRGINDSNVIAREIYLSCTNKTLNEYTSVRFSNYNQLDYISGFEGQLNLITKPDFRIPPQGILKLTNVNIMISENVDDDLLIEGVVGADASAPKFFKLEARKNFLRSFVAKVIRNEEKDMKKLTIEFFEQFLINM